MNAEFSNDILQPLPLERFAAYRNECIKHYPLGIKAHHFLFLQERWTRYLQAPANRDFQGQVSAMCVLKFYAHRSGDASKCTIVAIAELVMSSDVRDPSCVIFNCKITNIAIISKRRNM